VRVVVRQFTTSKRPTKARLHMRAVPETRRSRPRCLWTSRRCRTSLQLPTMMSEREAWSDVREEAFALSRRHPVARARRCVAHPADRDGGGSERGGRGTGCGLPTRGRLGAASSGGGSQTARSCRRRVRRRACSRRPCRSSCRPSANTRRAAPRRAGFPCRWSRVGSRAPSFLERSCQAWLRAFSLLRPAGRRLANDRHNALAARGAPARSQPTQLHRPSQQLHPRDLRVRTSVSRVQRPPSSARSLSQRIVERAAEQLALLECRVRQPAIERDRRQSRRGKRAPRSRPSSGPPWRTATRPPREGSAPPL